MKKIFLTGLATGFFLVGIASHSQAIPIQSETPVVSPTSTENLWAYSYLDSKSSISSAAFYYTSTSQFSAAIHQGYVTGEYGPWSATTDSFSSGGYSDLRTTHVFETYIMSSIDQTILLRTSGDDGHAIFMDDTFLAGGGYASTAGAYFTMAANTEYRLALAGTNYTGPWSFWFSMADETGVRWGGPVSEAENISMNATGDFDSVPEPATMLLFGTGLIGFVGSRLRRNKK